MEHAAPHAKCAVGQYPPCQRPEGFDPICIIYHLLRPEHHFIIIYREREIVIVEKIEVIYTGN
jgi:hypothetical protein